MTYQETLDYLFSRLPMYQRQGAAALKFNLDNIKALMKALGKPHEAVKTLHIAGTNGKGSSAHMLSSIMQEAGYKTGLYTSPHLKSFTERIRINGSEVKDSYVVDFVAKHKTLIETIEPSFFEITFAMAMQYFAEEHVDIAIIEVGMGGRLDSTNIITPEICLITNISLDHQHLLGDTLEKIATEKAGIIKQGVPVVVSYTQPGVNAVFIEKAGALAAPIYFADQLYQLEQAYGGRLNIIAENQIIHEGLLLDLKGEYQKYNLPGVLKVCHLLAEDGWDLPDTAVYHGLNKVITNTGLKGRWQQLDTQPLIIADTGHNEAGVKEVVGELARLPAKQLHLVWGMVNDKEVDHILSLLPEEAHYYFVQADIPRAMPAKELKTIAAKQNLSGSVFPTVMAGFQAAKQRAAMDDVIFIGGSTFVVAEIEEL